MIREGGRHVGRDINVMKEGGRRTACTATPLRVSIRIA